MSARAAASALLLFALAVPGSCPPAHAGPWLPARGEYSAELRGGLFSADSYRNDAGDRLTLDGRWEERSLGASVEMGWKKKISIVLAAPFVSASAVPGIGPSATSSSLEDVLVGARYGLAQGPTAAALELDWRAPLGYSRTGSLLANPVRETGLGHPQAYGGLEQLSLSLLYGRALAHRGFLQLGAGYGYRYLSFSKSGKHVFEPEGAPGTVDTIRAAKELWAQPVLLSADLGIWFHRTVLIGGRYAGSITTSHGALYPVRNIHLAGPVIVYRVDDRLDLSAGSWSTAAGRNVLHYDQVYVAVTFKQTHLNRLQGFLGGTKNP